MRGRAKDLFGVFSCAEEVCSCKRSAYCISRTGQLVFHILRRLGILSSIERTFELKTGSDKPHGAAGAWGAVIHEMGMKTLKRAGDSSVRVGNGSRVSAPVPDSRFDRRLAEILQSAAEIFYEKGYEGASMRDLSRQSGMSLSGLYHYFDSKEKLLYLIQRHNFLSILDRLQERLAGEDDPEERLRIFIGNHLEYFIANMKAMKVLSHEADLLKGVYGQEIQAIKREYYRICVELLENIRRARSGKNAAPSGRHQHRTEVLALFGMLNWIYTWYNPQIDPPARELAEQMAELYLCGVISERAPRKLRKGKAIASTES